MASHILYVNAYEWRNNISRNRHKTCSQTNTYIHSVSQFGCIKSLCIFICYASQVEKVSQLLCGILHRMTFYSLFPVEMVKSNYHRPFAGVFVYHFLCSATERERHKLYCTLLSFLENTLYFPFLVWPTPLYSGLLWKILCLSSHSRWLAALFG